MLTFDVVVFNSDRLFLFFDALRVFRYHQQNDSFSIGNYRSTHCVATNISGYLELWLRRKSWRTWYRTSCIGASSMWWRWSFCKLLNICNSTRSAWRVVGSAYAEARTSNRMYTRYMASVRSYSTVWVTQSLISEYIRYVDNRSCCCTRVMQLQLYFIDIYVRVVLSNTIQMLCIIHLLYRKCPFLLK